MKPIRLLCLFDYAAHTGFATVSQNLVPWWKRYYGNKPKIHENDTQPLELDICAVNYFGDLYDESDGVTVFSAKKSEPRDLPFHEHDDFGRVGFMQVLRDSVNRETKDGKIFPDAYDGIFILQDPGIISPIVPALKMLRDQKKQNNLKNFKSIFYFPLDHDQLEVVKLVVKDLEFFDVLVTYNEFSRKLVLDANPALKGKVQVIPHGINPKQFYPLSHDERQNFRKEFFGENADKFIILNLNRNQHRKDIPCTIFGFQEYKKKNPDAFLYLHMNPQDPMGWDLRGLLLQTGLKEGVDFMLPPREKQNHDYETDLVNKIYNACDVYLTTTTGEGCGLGNLESMACMLPVICPNHTSFPEMTDNGKRGYLLENLYPSCNTIDNTIRYQCDYLEVAETLEKVHYNIRNNREEHHEMVRKAFEYTLTLGWKEIAKRWVEIFKETY